MMRGPLKRFFDSWAGSHRNARGIAAAAALLVAILAMSALRCNPMLRREYVLGLVLEVEAQDLRSPATGEPGSRILIAAPDSTERRLFLPVPAARPGHFIPLIEEHYAKGNIEYILDLERWRIEGPT